MKKTALLSVISAYFVCTAPAYSDSGNAEEAGVTSMDALTGSARTPSTMFTTAAEYANSHGDYDKAIALCRKGLATDADDIALHEAYATALEEKWKSSPSSKRDTYIYDKCVEEWLLVLRNEAGIEKGLSFHGLHFPAMGHMYSDEETGMTARAHLISLTGVAPKAWQTDAKYLRKVLNRNELNGKVLRRHDPGQSGSSN